MSELGPDWVSAVAAHLQAESEDSLSQAYELGRRALAQGVGLLDLLALYGAVQDELVLSAPAADQSRLAAAVGSFFRELMSPYEMSFRGYREANSQLKCVNEDLKAAYAELQQKQLQLVGGDISERLMLPLSLSYDHRVINGADAARFVGKLVQMLGDAFRLLLES